MKKLFAALMFVATSVMAYPKPVGYVSDYADVLAKERLVIETRIGHFNKRTGAEIAVVTIKSLDGQSIESYAKGLFNTWGIGKKGSNNGVLILLAINDRKTRIEVGVGLEGTLTDSVCNRIIQEQMIPEFKRGSFGGGVNNALSVIFDRVR